MSDIFIVIRPDMNDDFVLAGVFSSFDAATACAHDPDAEYDGRVITIDPDAAKDTYHSPYADEDDDVA